MTTADGLMLGVKENPSGISDPVESVSACFKEWREVALWEQKKKKKNAVSPNPITLRILAFLQQTNAEFLCFLFGCIPPFIPSLVSPFHLHLQCLHLFFTVFVPGFLIIKSPQRIM